MGLETDSIVGKMWISRSSHWDILTAFLASHFFWVGSHVCSLLVYSWDESFVLLKPPNSSFWRSLSMKETSHSFVKDKCKIFFFFTWLNDVLNHNAACLFTYSQVTSVMWDPLVEVLWIALRWPTPGRWACSQRSDPGKFYVSTLGSKREPRLYVKVRPWKQIGFSFRGWLIFYYLGHWRIPSNWVTKCLTFDLGKWKSALYTDQRITFCIWQ